MIDYIFYEFLLKESGWEIIFSSIIAHDPFWKKNHNIQKLDKYKKLSEI